MCEHGTKTTLVFLPADGEPSWSLLPSSVSLPSGGFKKEKEALMSTISSILSKNQVAPQNVIIEELLIEQKMNLKLSGKKLKNTLFLQNMIFKNILVYKLNNDIKL